MIVRSLNSEEESFRSDAALSMQLMVDPPEPIRTKFLGLQLRWIRSAATSKIAEEFFNRKRACYGRFNAVGAATYANEAHPHLDLVVAVSKSTGRLAGGVAIYGRSEGYPLPLERQLGHEPLVRSEMVDWDSLCVAELSSLWIEPEWRRTGVSGDLLTAAIAACRSRRVDRIVAFSHHHVVDFYRSVGLEARPDLGTYAYPDENYASQIVWCDPVRLVTVPPERRSALRLCATRLSGGGVLPWPQFPEADQRPIVSSCAGPTARAVA